MFTFGTEQFFVNFKRNKKIEYRDEECYVHAFKAFA